MDIHRTHCLRFPALAALALVLMAGRLPLAAADIGPDQVKSLVASAPGAADYPQASAIILYDYKKLTVHADNSQSLDEHLLVKILKDRGRRFGDQKRMYDVATDSLSVLQAQSWLPDGTTVPVEPKAINVITPPELVGAAVYADVKQKVISFPSIAPGTVIELAVHTDSRPDTTDRRIHPYWDLQVFQGTEPVLARSYELQLPAGAPEPLVYEGNGLGAPTLDSTAESRLYRWEMKDVPMIYRIEDMPPELQYAPYLLFSNVNTWESLGRWLADKFYPAAAPDSSVRARAAELTRGAASAADSVRVLCLFVVKNVRTVPLSLGLAGWKPHAAARVLENMYGEQLDKAVLLSSLLTAAGFDNYPALAGGDQVDVSVAKVPAAIQFDRLLIYVPGEFRDSVFANSLYAGSDRRGLWLVPIARYNRYGYFNSGQDSRAVVILPSGGTLYRTTAFPPEKSLARYTGKLEVQPSGDVEGEFEARTDGLFDAQARTELMDLTPKELEQTFQQAANSINEGARLIKWNLSDLKDLCLPAGASIQFQAPELGVVQGDMMILRLPSPPFAFASLPYFPQLRERDYDFVASGPFVLSGEITLTLPEGWKVAYSPPAALEEGRFGNWVSGCRQEGRSVVLTRRLTVTAREVSNRDYADFRQFMEKYSLPEHRLLLLERRGSGSNP